MSDDLSSTKTDSSDFGADEQRRLVRDRYSSIATESSSCCDDSSAEENTRKIYSADEIGDAPAEADLGLGCGNPTAIASLQAGETVVDLGSGGGFDCFLAAKEVGPDGHVIGVDMTPEMIEKARENSRKNETSSVEFRLGEIEHLPVADESVDVIISNCVVNLSPEKSQVFSEAYRTLKPGGRLAISDVVLTAELPSDVQRDPESVSACVAGASQITELESILHDVGFTEISITPKEQSEEFIREWDDERDLSEYLVSANIEARKPVQ